MIVCKFGGTSVSRFVENIEQILKNKERKIVVFSAFGKRNSNDEKITDLLIEVCRKNIIAENYDEELNKIKKRFQEIISAYKINININKIFNNIIKKYKKTGDCDYLISRGEYLTTLILSKYLKIKFIPCENVLFFNNFNPDYKKINKKISKYLKKYNQIAIPGFYGINNKKIFIFERGGSDYSGAVIASSMNCRLYENWTDVDGVFPANPTLFDVKKNISVISYEELERFVFCDATVIAHSCIRELAKGNCVLRIRNTKNPIQEGTTVINSQNKHINFFTYQRNENRYLICFNFENLFLRRKIAKTNGLVIRDGSYAYYVCDKNEFDRVSDEFVEWAKRTFEKS